MRWHAQVVHVARKDLWLLRWPLLAYAIVVGLTTLSAGAVIEPGSDSALLGAMGVFVLGAIVAAMAVYTDDPASTRALWPTRPLSPSAVFAAKVLLIEGVLVGIISLGALAALVLHAVPLREMPPLLARSAAIFGTTFAIAAMVAVVTPGLRAFIPVGLVAFLCVQLLVRRLPAWQPGSGQPTLLGAWPVLAVTVYLAVALMQYTNRRIFRTRVIVLASLALAVVRMPAPQQRASRPRELPEMSPVIQLQVLPVQLPTHAGDESLSLQLGLSGDHPEAQYWITNPRLWLDDGSGRERAIPVRFYHPVVPGAGIRAVPTSAAARNLITLAHAGPLIDAMKRGTGRLIVEGTVELRALRPITSMPLEAGATGRAVGRRLRILSVSGVSEPTYVLVRVSLIRVSPPEWQAVADRDLTRDVSYEIVDPAGGTRAILPVTHSSGGSGTFLPGLETNYGTSTLSSRPFRPMPARTQIVGRGLPPAPTPPAIPSIGPNTQLVVSAWTLVGTAALRVALDVASIPIR
jgi:hypothetical protein